MLHIQKFLNDTNTDLKELYDNYGIDATNDESPVPSKYVFNYGQTTSSKTGALVQECRGLIIDVDENKIVSRSFDRFYNYGEALDITKLVSYPDSYVTKKYDGSLVNLYWCEKSNSWLVATRKTTNSRKASLSNRESTIHYILKGFGINVDDIDPSMGDEQFLEMSVFEQYMERLNSFCEENKLEKGWTYIFEFVSPLNNIVTQYDDHYMVLLAVRNVEYGHYVDKEFLINQTIFTKPEIMIDAPKDENEVLDFVSSMNRNSNQLLEGVVVFDSTTGIMVKIKNSVYVKAHRSIGENGINEKNILELVSMCEEDEYLSYYPEDKEKFVPYVEAREKVFDKIKIGFDLYSKIEDRKTLANELKQYGVANYIFSSAKKGVYNHKSAFSNSSIKQRINSINENMN